MITITLPWPDRTLHPNARVHWAAKAKATKAARVVAFYLTREVCGTTLNWARAKLDITFNPPNNRRRDLDGLISSLKAAQDGISDAVGIDDSLFEPTYRIGPARHGGNVVVTIQPL